MAKKRIGYNILLWLVLYLFWIVVFQQRTFAFSKTITVQFCYLLFVAANYYFSVYFAIPLFLYKKKYAMFAALFLAAVFTAALLRVPLATFLSEHFFAPGKQTPGFFELFFNSVINIFIWTICLVAGKLIIDRIRFQKYIDAIEKEKIKNELDFLKAQFNPHFLFNSINSIYGNIDKTNSSARKMLLTFSEMLRYQLYECNVEAISVDKEVNYIRNYIALQQTRKPENLEVELNIDEHLKGFKIAPLLFTAFIENAFKYVSHFESKMNRIQISLRRNDDNIVFRAFNTKENLNGHALPDHGGIGIANVKRRLELLYPWQHTLTTNNTTDSYEVILNLQI